MANKNIRHLRVSPEILIAICQENKNQRPGYYAVTKNPLPDDAVVVGIVTEYHSDGIIMDLEIESKEFTENVPDPLPTVEHTQMVVVRASNYFVGGKED